MERSDPRYQAYVEILKEELIPAMGCTEPIALAYAAARAREVLGALPESVQLQVSGSIIKNVKSVIVPNTGHLKGMEAAVAAGIIAGSADRELEVISEVSEDKQAAIRDYLQTVPISIQHIEQGHVFDIIVTERSGDSYAKVRIADFHTNICLIEKNGRVLYEKPLLNEEARRDSRADRSLLNMKVAPGNSSIFVGKKEFEIMKKPGRGTNGHIAIGCNNVDRAIYHLSQRGVKFDLDSKVVKNGKTIACYFADEIGGFAFHLVQA